MLFLNTDRSVVDSNSALTNWVTYQVHSVSDLYMYIYICIVKYKNSKLMLHSTSEEVMLGKEVLRSLMVYSRTKTALLG